MLPLRSIVTYRLPHLHILRHKHLLYSRQTHAQVARRQANRHRLPRRGCLHQSLISSAALVDIGAVAAAAGGCSLRTNPAGLPDLAGSPSDRGAHES